MDAAPPFWTERRVLVCGVTGPLGAALAEVLAEQGAEVSGIVSESPGDESSFLNRKLYERIRPVRSSATHSPTIAAEFAAGEVELIIDTTRTNARATYAILAAARVAVPHAAIVLSIPGPASRTLPMANRFRAERLNPIAVAVVPEAVDLAVEHLVETARRCLLRDSAVMTGWTERQTTEAATRRAA